MDPWWTRCRAEDNEYHCCGSFSSGSQALCQSYIILYVWETGLLLTQWLTKTMHDKPKIQFSFVGPSDLLPVFSSPLLAAWPRQVSFYFSAFLEWLLYTATRTCQSAAWRFIKVETRACLLFFVMPFGELGKSIHDTLALFAILLKDPLTHFMG